MKLCLSPPPEALTNVISALCAAGLEHAVPNLESRILRLLSIGNNDDELHLHTDHNEFDLLWVITREGREHPVMVGLLHFDGKDSWSSHT